VEFPSFDIPPNSTAGIRVTSETKKMKRKVRERKIEESTSYDVG
jgi:hypothetical protein